MERAREEYVEEVGEGLASKLVCDGLRTGTGRCAVLVRAVVGCAAAEGMGIPAAMASYI